MTRLHDLYLQCGQSPWLDNLRRDDLESGRLRDFVERGVRGVTTNPTIFHNAISNGESYSDQIAECRRVGKTASETYWDLVIEDVKRTCDMFAVIHQESGGEDGFVSLEVDPHLAMDAAGTVSQARELVRRVDRPNLMIKVPATTEGLIAIKDLLADGISVNVTLIFGVARYLDVLRTFRDGVSECAKRTPNRLAHVRSVASFFISRVDTLVDPLLVGQERSDIAGRTAIEMAAAAYERFGEFFAGQDWAELERLGCHRQRPLWASTSTKNPLYPELLYVESLIGRSTVNTLPEPTLLAFESRGTVETTLDRGAQAGLLEAVSHSGIDLDEICMTLETQGLESFQRSFDDLLKGISLRLS